MTTEHKADNNICHTINPVDNIDPFEGLDLSEICVPSPEKESSASSPESDDSSGGGLFDLNPLDGIDLKDFSLTPEVIGTSTVSPGQEPPAPHLDSGTAIPADQPTKPSESGAMPQEPSRPLPPQKVPRNQLHPIIEKAYHYAELTQIRQKVFAALEEKGGKTILVASPLDNTGSSLLAAALAYNAACSCQQHVLLIDCNMRRAGLHEFFSVPQSYGFTDLVRNNLPWQAVVKETSIEGLSIITAGDSIENFSDYLRYAHIPKLVADIQNKYDLIIFDTSPILKPNRSNVNIVSLTAVTDYFLLITKQSGTTKDLLKETKDIVEAGNGKIDGIVINEHSPSSKPAPYKK